MKLLILALVTFSYCCSAAQILQNSDESLQTFIQTLPQTLGVDLKINVQAGRVEVVGHHNNIQKLQDFLNNKDSLFTAHLPQAQPFVTKFTDETNTLTWERLLSCIGLEKTSSGLCGSQFKDQEGSALSISGKNNSGNMRMAKGYFQILGEKKCLFFVAL